MTADIREWLTARLDAEEEVARRVAERYRIQNPLRDDDGKAYWPLPSVEANFRGRVDPDILAGLELIKAHDPARILAEVAAKRQILAEHGTMWRDIGWLDEERCEAYEELEVCARCVPKHSHFRTRADVPVGPCRTVRLLAAPYRSEPGFDTSWEVT
jgi:hypothetical protein